MTTVPIDHLFPALCLRSPMLTVPGRLARATSTNFKFNLNNLNNLNRSPNHITVTVTTCDLTRRA